MGIIATGPGSPLAFSSASGGKVFGLQQHKRIRCASRGASKPFSSADSLPQPGSNDIFIAPSNVQNVLGTAPTTPSDVALALSMRLSVVLSVSMATAAREIEGECQGAWQALAVTGAGTTNPLTVIDSNN